MQRETDNAPRYWQASNDIRSIDSSQRERGIAELIRLAMFSTGPASERARRELKETYGAEIVIPLAQVATLLFYIG